MQAKFCLVRAGEEVPLSGMRREQRLQNTASAEVSWNPVTVQVNSLVGCGRGVGEALSSRELVLRPKGCNSAARRTGTVCLSLTWLPFYSYCSSCCLKSHLRKHKADAQPPTGERPFPRRVFLLRTLQRTGISSGFARPGFLPLSGLETAD